METRRGLPSTASVCVDAVFINLRYAFHSISYSITTFHVMFHVVLCCLLLCYITLCYAALFGISLCYIVEDHTYHITA